MRPLTDHIPKPLVPIQGVPILSHIFNSLPEVVDEIVLVVKYRGDQIRDFYGAAYRGRPITYVEQGLPDGTGGALMAAQSVLHDRFLVMNGDDLHGAQALAILVTNDVAILGAVSDEPQHYGVLALNSDGTLQGIDEKPEHPKSNLVTTGTMVLDMQVFSYVTPAVNGEVRLTDMVERFAQDVPICVVSQPHWCPVGRPEDIPRAVEFLERCTTQI